MDAYGFFKRHPGAQKIGFDPYERGRVNGSERNRQRLLKFAPRLAKLAQDAIAQVKEPMQPEFDEEGDPLYPEQPYKKLDTPQKQVAAHTIEAAKEVQHHPDPDVNRLCQHLHAAMRAAKQSPQGHELMPHLEALYNQISGGDGEEDQVGDSDPYNKRF
jgi:hypothetical protein